MSSSVSRLALPRVLKIAFVLTGILGQSLFAQQAAVVPAQVKSTPGLTISGKVSSSNATQTKADVAAQKKAELQYLHLPLSFERNEGQADAGVRFLSRGAGYGLFLTDREAVLSFGGQKASSIKLRFLNADAKNTISGIDRLGGTSNYFLGNDRSKWHTNVPNFGKVEYKNLYSGIDLVYYGNQQRIEHDFIIAPQVDASKIRFAIGGAKKLALDKRGDLVVTTAAGELRLRKPAIYQTINGARKEIAGGYALKRGNEVSFALGAYDRTRELTIDPVLILSTYLADAAGVTVTGLASDSTGIYVTGYTQATSLRGVTPTLSNSSTGDDVFVAKLDAAGNQLLYSTFIGGNGTDRATGIAVSSQNAYVTGYTTSSSTGTAFPTSTGAYQADLQGSATQAAFVLQLHNDGAALDYSSYYGPTTDNTARATAIALNGGFIYVAGSTDSDNLPTAGTSFQDGTAHVASTQSGFFAQFDPAQSGLNSLPYASYIAGSAGNVIANAIAATAATKVYVAGQFDDKLPQNGGTELTTAGTNDGFVLQFDPTNGTASAQLTKATQIGGTGDDTVGAISVDSGTANVYVAGQTHSTGLAAGSPFNGTLDIGAGTDGFVARLDSTGALNYFSYIGGTGIDSASSIAFDGTNIYVAGTTASGDLGPVNGLQGTLSGTSDGFVAKVNPAGGGGTDLIYLTYFGGSGDEQVNAVSLNGSGTAVIIAGTSTSTDLSTTASAFQPSVSTTNNSFVASLDANGNTIDLSVTGSVDKDPIIVRPSRHDSFTLTFHVSVASGTAHSVQFNYPVPGTSAAPKLQFGTLDGGSTSIPVMTSQGSCSTGSNGVSCLLGDVTSASTVTITVPATTTANAEALTGTILNVVTVSAAESLTTPANATTTVTNHIVQDADLQPSFSTPLTGPLTDGQTGVGFTVRVTNNSTGTANDLTAGVAKVSGSFAGTNSTITGLTATGCTVDDTAHTYTCTLDALAHGAFQDFTFSGGTSHVTSGIKDDLTLSATVAPTQTSGVDNYVDGNNANNTQSTTVPVQPVTDLQPSFTSTPSGSLTDGQTGIGFTVRVTNNGAAPTNDLATGAATVSGSFAGTNSNITGLTASGCTVDDTAHTYSCTLNAIAHSAVQDFAFTGGTAHVTGGIASSLTFTATVAPTQAASIDNYHDTNTGNDSAAPVTVSIQPVTHLTAAFTATQPSPVKEGDPVSYQITVTNAGGTPANDLASNAAQLSGSLIGSGSFITINSFAGCTSSSGVGTSSYTCVLPAMAGAGGTAVVTLQGTAHVTAGIKDRVTITASPGANAGGYFDNPGPTAAVPATLDVQPVTDLQPSITVPGVAVNNGAAGTQFTITVTNNGTGAVNNLAAGAATVSGTFTGANVGTAFTITAVSPGCTIVTSSSYSCTTGALTFGNAQSFTITGTPAVTRGIQDTLTVTANVASTQSSGVNNYFDSLLGNDSANASTQGRPVTDLAVSFVLPPANVTTGSSTTYAIRVTNNGSGAANNLTANAAKVAGSFVGANSSFTINMATLPTGCTAPTSSTFVCVLSASAFGTNQTFPISGTVTLNSGHTSDTLTLSATVSPNVANDYFDNDTTNDGPLNFNSNVQGIANLTLNFSGSATPVLVGNNLTYNLTVSNAAGASDAAGVNVTIPLVVGQVFQAGLSSGNCSGTTTITCLMGAAGVVQANTSSSATVVVLSSPALVPNGASGSPRQVTYLQSATVNVDATQTVNSNAANKTQNVNSTFTAAAHITVQTSPSANPIIIQSGGLAYVNEVYTTTVTNVAGRSDAQGVVITDMPPLGPNVTFVSANFAVSGGASGVCSGPTSGKVTCSLPLMASGNTATITVTVTPQRSATTPPTSLTDAISLTSSDVVDPGPPGGTSDGSTIPVDNTTTGLSLPLTAGSSGRNAVLTFGSVTTPGVTSFDTSSNFGGLSLDPKYPLGVQPATPLLYNFSTTAVTSTPVQFCLDASLQTFAKPERVRMFLLSAGAPVDITTSISPIPTVPTAGKPLTTVCGLTAFSNTSRSIAIFEPANNAPVLNASNASPVAPFPNQGVTGQVILDATSADDPDNNVCNGSAVTSPIICRDKDQLTYRWTTSNPLGFTDANKNPIGATLNSATPSNVFLPLGKNQTITLSVTDQLGVTTSNSFVRNVVNTPALSVADVLPVDGEIAGNAIPVAVRFFNVGVEGVTKLNTQAPSSAPSGYRFGTNGVRYNISTDATINGSTQLCVDISNQRFVKPERVRLIQLAPTFGDVTTSIIPVPTIPSKGQVVNTVCGLLSGFSTGLVQVAALEPVNNPPVIGLTFSLSNSQDAGKGVTGNFVDLNLASSFDPDVNACNGNSSQCSDTPQLRFFVFGPFPGALQSTSTNPIIRNVSLPGGTTTITIVAIDQTITVPTNAVINVPGDLANLPGAAGQNGLTTTQFPVTIDSTTPGGGSTGNTATILAGQSASFIFTPVNPNGGVLQGSGTLNLTCSNGPTTPSLDSLHITCGVTPTTFTIGSSSAPALLVSTTGATLGLAQPSVRPGAPLYAIWVAFVGMPFAGIVVISISRPRRRWVKMLLGFALLALAVGSQVACGGGSSMAPSTKFSTPRGTYEIVVTGTQNGTALSKNSFTITVQ